MDYRGAPTNEGLTAAGDFFPEGMRRNWLRGKDTGEDTEDNAGALPGFRRHPWTFAPRQLCQSIAVKK